MMHMLQVLPPFSHRQRSGVEYFDVVPRALIRNIDPHKPHTLMPLGRADVRVGPMVYYGVRFWEVRPSVPPTYPKPRPPPTTSAPHGIVQYPASVRPPPGAAGYIRSPSGYVRPAPPPGGTPYATRPPSAATQAGANSAAPQDTPRPFQTAPGNAESAPAAANRSEGPVNTGPTEVRLAEGTASASAARPPTSATSTDNTIPAANAATPKAETPSQGPARAPVPPMTSTPARPPPPQSAPSGAPGPGMPSASLAPSRPAPRPLDAGFLSRLQQRAEHDKHLQNLLQLARSNQLPESALPQLNAIIASLMVPPPPKPEEQGPPVVLVEFPENPSINFVLPLWHMAIERRRIAGARRGHSVLLSFFLPSIGSKAAGESGRKDAEHVDQGMLLDASMWSKAPTPPPQSSTPETRPAPSAPTPESANAPKAEPDSAAAEAKRNARGKRVRPKKEASPAKPERGHELYPTTWFLRAELGIDERLWDCLGRVPGCVTSEPNRERMFASDADKERFEKLQQSFTARFNGIPPPTSLPRSVALSDIPPSLEEHITDRYAMRIQSSTTRPQPKRKVATLSDSREPRAPRVDHHVPRNYAAEILDGEPRPKRKRHVATHNPDGSLKSCGACGKTKTPMWRRGPKGPSQLCNACGAKWKAGRLVVPEVPPPPILDDTLPVRRVATPVSQSPAPAPP